MFLERTLELIERKNISKNKLLTDLKLSKNSFVNWSERGTVPSAETIEKIADYFGVTTDYLLGRTDLTDTEKTMKLTLDDIRNLSEAQRAMLKCRIHQLMINKYQKDDFFEDLNDKLNINNSYMWFYHLNDFSLDDKIPQMLIGTEADLNSLFDKMSIVIKNKATATALSVDYSGDTAFPILVAGNKIFPALSTMSLASLDALENGLQRQIDINQTRSDTNIEDDLVADIKSSLKTKAKV
jgi:transcriptional regulator with XRE-family HTH domain